MTLNQEQREELYGLFGLLFDEQIDDAGRERLSVLLDGSEEARWLYIREANFHASLAWDWSLLTAEDGRQAGVRGQSDAVEVADRGAADFMNAAQCVGATGFEEAAFGLPRFEASLPGASERRGSRADAYSPSHPAVYGDQPVVVNLSGASVQPSLGLFAPGGILFSYGASALLVAVGLLIGWVRQMPVLHPAVADARATLPETASAAPSPAAEPEVVFVGRITGMVDCRWADQATEAFESAFVPLGRRFALASGLMEITYKNGATVLLQGPATYEVDSLGGGYLTLGKLTARVEQKAASGEGSAAREAAAKDHAPLFTVRTPTATVTDVGTEFGVEVDASGASKAYVFRGKVELRLAGDKAQASRVIPLNENESASVARAADRNIQIVRNANRQASFARRIPNRAAIKLHHSGAGLKLGDPDPHWQLVARSDEPNFKPRPLVVVAVNSDYRLPNDPEHSQWLSTAGEFEILPDEVVYTLRTTFDLTDTIPGTAVLRGRFLVDDHVQAIRLNGRNVELPKYSEEITFFNFRDFRVTKGFVEGVNVLEIDVLNGGYAGSTSATMSYMACRVELEGSVVPSWKKQPENSTSQ